MFKKSVSTAQLTHCISIKNTDWLNLHAIIVTVVGIVRSTDVHCLGTMQRLSKLKYNKYRALSV